MDVAALSMSVDTTDVVKATADLDKFSAAASKAGATTGKSTGSVSRMVEQYARAARHIDQVSSAAHRAAAANDNVTRASAGVARATANADAHVAAYRKHLAAIPAAANQAATGIERVTKAVTHSAGAIKANTGNIAAQFQDIGITAAMGMNPLLIGLQQGTQLSAVFAQSGGSLAKTLAGAFGQIANAQALATIGLVAGVAALIQMVDWAKLAQRVMNGLASILEDIAPYALAAASALALIYAPGIIAGIAALTKGFAGLAASMLACIPIPVLIVAGLTAIVAAANHWRDDLTRIFGVDIVGAAKSGINYIVGGFVGAYNAVRATWADLPAAIGDAAITAANRVIDATSGMVSRVKQELNDLFVLRDTETGKTRRLFNFDTKSSLGHIDNPYAGAASRVNGVAAREIGAAQGRDWVGGFVAGARDIGRAGADMLRGWADGMGVSDKTDKADKAGRAAKMSEEARALQERNRATEQYIAGLTEEVAKIGLSDEALRKYEVTQALSRATTDAQRDSIIKLSAEREKALTTLRQTQELEAAQKALEAARAGITSGVDIELQTMGLVGAEREREVVRIQRQIALTGILTKIKAAEADGNTKLADTYRQLAEAVDEKYAKQMQAVDGREMVEKIRAVEDIGKRGLASLNQGLVDAMMGVESLGDVFKKVANQIIADLLRIAIQRSIIEPLTGALFGGGGGGGGFFGSLLGGLFAKGGAFDHAQKFADGGAFTNQVVNNPTLFKFANGGKLGLMGEEGPEAIMPLGRTSDGKLGVYAIAGKGSAGAGAVGDCGGGDTRTINVEVTVNVNNSFAGAIGVESIAAMQRQSMEATKEQFKRELSAALYQLDRDGSIA